MFSWLLSQPTLIQWGLFVLSEKNIHGPINVVYIYMKVVCSTVAERNPFQGLKVGSCLTLGNELSEETHVLTKQEILLGKGTQVESSRVREPRSIALPSGSQSWVLWRWVSFWVVFSQSFWLRVLPGGACLIQPRWMPERRILGGGQTCGVSFWPFLNSSCWWCLISSVFLTRTSCKWLLWCPARQGGFSQCASPNTNINLYTAVSFTINTYTLIHKISLFIWLLRGRHFK